MKGKTRIMRPGRDPKSGGREGESRKGLLGHARHPFALIGALPPFRPFAERRRALLRRFLAPTSSPETTGRRARSNLNGRAREPMSFRGTERLQGSEREPRSVFGAGREPGTRKRKRKSETKEERRAQARTSPRRAGVRGRHCLLTTGGLIGVGRQVGARPLACRFLNRKNLERYLPRSLDQSHSTNRASLRRPATRS